MTKNEDIVRTTEQDVFDARIFIRIHNGFIHFIETKVKEVEVFDAPQEYYDDWHDLLEVAYQVHDLQSLCELAKEYDHLVPFDGASVIGFALDRWVPMKFAAHEYVREHCNSQYWPEYVAEAEHGDGAEYWMQFDDVVDVMKDYLMFAEFEDERRSSK